MKFVTSFWQFENLVFVQSFKIAKILACQVVCQDGEFLQILFGKNLKLIIFIFATDSPNYRESGCKYWSLSWETVR